MKVIVDPRAGFCPGVRRAVKTVEDLLQQGKSVTALGALIHNPREIARLAELGLHTIPQEQAAAPEALQQLPVRELFVRTHGLSEMIREGLESAGFCLIDGTCTTVQRVQQQIAAHHDRGEQIIIVGKKGHAEVEGLLGYCDDQGIVVESEQDLAVISPDRPTFVVAQTTIGRDRFQLLSGLVRDRVAQANVLDTTCGYITRRYDQVREFARQVDVIVFVGGKASSNSRVLFEICRKANPRSHAIEALEQIDAEWFSAAGTIGLTGGASTPLWQLEEIRDLLLKESSRFEQDKKT